MRKRRFVPAAAVFLAVFATSARADVSFTTQLLSAGMVLQQGMPVPIWGRADPDEQVTVSMAGQEHVTTADATGHWRVDLDPMTAGGPFTLTAAGANQVQIDEVRVGEVWVCGGQSNMVLGFPSGAELLAYPDIHTFALTAFLLGDLGGTWTDLPSRSCWELGTRLSDALGVPIGLLNSAASGTRIRAWVGPAVMSDPDPAVAPILATYDEIGRLYEERVAVLQPYAIRGVAWWQGESDRKQATEHVHMLPALIRSWRIDWERPDLPFVTVQLPTGKGLFFGRRPRRLPRRVDYVHRTPTMRQAFFGATQTVANLSLVITADLPGGTHPSMKYRPLYGERMANAVLAEVYGQSLFDYAGPIADSATAEAGGRVRVRFRPNTAEGLQPGGGPLQGVALLTEQNEWVWAEAEIQGNELVAWHPGSSAPTAIRFGYGRSLRWANLYNGAEMLAAPFELPVMPSSNTTTTTTTTTSTTTTTF